MAGRDERAQPTTVLSSRAADVHPAKHLLSHSHRLTLGLAHPNSLTQNIDKSEAGESGVEQTSGRQSGGDRSLCVCRHSPDVRSHQVSHPWRIGSRSSAIPEDERSTLRLCRPSPPCLNAQDRPQSALDRDVVSSLLQALFHLSPRSRCSFSVRSFDGRHPPSRSAVGGASTERVGGKLQPGTLPSFKSAILRPSSDATHPSHHTSDTCKGLR